MPLTNHATPRQTARYLARIIMASFLSGLASKLPGTAARNRFGGKVAIVTGGASGKQRRKPG